MEIKNPLFGEWPAPSRQYLRAVELWEDYYASTDAFDGGPGQPPPYLRAASSRYAFEQRRRLSDLAGAEGITQKALMEAMHDVLRREFFKAARPR